MKESYKDTINTYDLSTCDKVIYIAHAYGGDDSNKFDVEMIIQDLLYEDRIAGRNICYFSPIHAFGYLYNALSYEDGMKLCKTMLDRCDEMWVFGEASRGVKWEIAYCERYKIPWKCFVK